MSEGSLQFDSAELRKSSDAVNYPAETVKKALAAFYAKTGALPPQPWGNDEIGEKFAEVYEGHTDNSPDSKGRRGHYKVLGALEDLGKGMGNLGEKVEAMADTYESAEDANRR
jgi:hypothetical protein